VLRFAEPGHRSRCSLGQTAGTITTPHRPRPAPAPYAFLWRVLHGCSAAPIMQGMKLILSADVDVLHTRLSLTAYLPRALPPFALLYYRGNFGVSMLRLQALWLRRAARREAAVRIRVFWADARDGCVRQRRS
jgi:hypothetical protein